MPESGLVCRCRCGHFLRIVFLAFDFAALPVLGAFESGALFPGYDAVGLGFRFFRRDRGLPGFKPRGLSGGQLPGCLALFDARGLIGLALVDIGCIGALCKRGGNQCRGQDGEGCRVKGSGVHAYSFQWIDELGLANVLRP